MFSPDDYAKNTPTLDRVNKQFVPRLVNSMNWNFSGGAILDYGSGHGHTGHELLLPNVLQCESTMYSVDISSSMVNFASRNFPHSKVVYACGSLPYNFPFPNVSFDKIFCINVFHFIQNISPTLSSMASHLKSGGELGFTSTTLNFPIMQTLSMWRDSEKWAEYLSSCQEFAPLWSNYKTAEPIDHFRDIFVNQTGLKEIKLEYVNITVPTTMEAIVDICMAMNPCLDKVPEQMHSELRKEYESIMKPMLSVSSDKPKEVLVPLEYVYGVLKKE